MPVPEFARPRQINGGNMGDEVETLARVKTPRTMAGLITVVAAIMAAVMPVSTANASESFPAAMTEVGSGADRSVGTATDEQSDAILAHFEGGVLSYGSALEDPAVDPALLYDFAVAHMASGGAITDVTSRQRLELELASEQFFGDAEELTREAFDVTDDNADGDLSNGDFQYVVDGEVYTASVDTEAGTTTITDPTGSETVVEHPTQTTVADAPNQVMASGVACWVLVWVVGILHQYGWGVAVGIILASGATGAAAMAIVYSMGVSLFFAWVSSKC
jgi:hypothetical protein